MFRKVAILALTLALVSGAALALPQPAGKPTPAEIGIAGVTQSDIDIVWAYTDRSNAARQVLTQINTEPPSPERDAKLKAQWAETSKIDDEAAPIIRKLIFGGYWTNSDKRNANFDNDVFLVLQHLKEPDLRKLTLEQTWPLVQKGLFRGEMYGLMYDRTALMEGRPQRYGSQMSGCIDGHLTPDNLEDPEHVNDRRKALGFAETEEDYIAHFKDEKCVSRPATKTTS